MKIFIITTLIIIQVSHLSFCQVSKQENKERIIKMALFQIYANDYEQLDNKREQFLKGIKVGSSITLIKKKLGDPFSIELGFPDVDALTVDLFPKFVGQMNYTTWVYKKKTITSEHSVDFCYINDVLVENYIYSDCLGKSHVFMYKDFILPPSADLNDHFEGDLYIKEPIKSMEIRPTKIISRYTPVLCIIFEKGTQVVAEAKLFFYKQLIW